MDVDTFMTSVRTATTTRDASLLKKAAHDFEVIVFMAGEVPSSLIEWILGWLQSPEYLAMQGSWPLLYIFESNWDALSESQRMDLFTVMEATYALHEDWMSCFVITEMLGNNYADDRALALLQRLTETPSDVRRSLVPHGLEHFASSSVPDLAARATALLHTMARDASPRVREEVAKSLRTLASHAQ